MPSSRWERLDRGVVLLFALLVVTLIATGVAALTGSSSPDVTALPRDVGGPAHPGVPLDTSVVLVNRTGGPIRMVSATVVPAKGYATPTLAHIGIIHRPGEIGGEMGWPPPMFSPGLFRDVTVGRGQIDLAVGLSAARPGTYGIRGLRVTYIDGSRTGHVDTVSEILLCVSADRQPSCGKNVFDQFTASLS